MVVIRPVVGVRNPVRSTSSSSYLRAKNAGAGLPESTGKPHPGNTNPGDKKQAVSPVQLLEAAPSY